MLQLSIKYISALNSVKFDIPGFLDNIHDIKNKGFRNWVCQIFNTEFGSKIHFIPPLKKSVIDVLIKAEDKHQPWMEL